MADAAFTSTLGTAGSSVYLTSPVLPVGLYPSSAQRVLGDYRRTFGSAADAHALYGYEAMRDVLDAIRRAGQRGNDRQAVIDRFFAAAHPDSVLGPYAIEGSGETTAARYGADRIVAGRPVLYRSFSIR
jgi:branched-chain amino acid transport system substrate-binding protein